MEFTRKNSAQFALRKCNEGCFFLTASLRPVLVENYEALDDIDGFPEKNAPKKNQDFFKSRSVSCITQDCSLHFFLFFFCFV